MAALGEDPLDIIGGSGVPDYAAALILELYEQTETGQRSVQVHYKAGAESDTDILLPLTYSCDASLTCDLDHLVLSTGLGGNDSDNLYQQWCRACGNQVADVCMRATLQTNNADSSTCQAEEAALYGVSAALAVVLAMVVAWALNSCCRRRAAKPVSSPASSKETDPTSSSSCSNSDLEISSSSGSFA